MSFNSGDEPDEQSWAYVARDAINERLDDLGWNQQELVRRSGVSATTVRWLQTAVVRSYQTATLSRVSKALGWPGGALSKILKGGSVPEFETDTPAPVLADSAADLVDASVGATASGTARSSGGAAARSGIDISDLDADDQEIIRAQVEFLRQRRKDRQG